jgi:cation:H+ antiporter
VVTAIVFILVGIVFLYFGGEGLVLGGARLALRAGVGPLVVGLTVVSFSTSMPEALTSLIAAIHEQYGDLAMGNVIGSNIVNVGLVFGIAALIRPLELHQNLWRREMPLMVGVCALLFFFMLGDHVGRAKGLILFILFIAYTCFQIWIGRKENRDPFIDPRDLLNTPWRWTKAIIYITGGVVGLVFGAYLLVQGAVYIAQVLGMSQRVIGLTIVALGTSLPELATSAVAAYRGKSDIAIGNVVGSNVFNILFIVGLVALIVPISFSRRLLVIDTPFMIGMAALLWLFFWRRTHVARWQGVVMIAVYCAYVAVVLTLGG